MNSKLSQRLLRLSILTLLAASCTNNNEVNDDDNKTSDTSQRSAINRPTYTRFDTSRSVTTISPKLYTEVADTLNMRMLQATYRPGDSSILHAHPDFAMYILEGSLVELTAENGSKQNINFVKGMSVIMPAGTHSAKNIGKNILRLVVVEVDRPRE